MDNFCVMIFFRLKHKGKMKESKGNKDNVKKIDLQKEKNMISCWICAKDNYVENCPLKKKLKSLEKVENPSVGVLQVLGAIGEEKLIATQDLDVMILSYVQVEINGKMTLAMVESGATHNFMREDIA